MSFTTKINTQNLDVKRFEKLNIKIEETKSMNVNTSTVFIVFKTIAEIILLIFISKRGNLIIYDLKDFKIISKIVFNSKIIKISHFSDSHKDFIIIERYSLGKRFEVIDCSNLETLYTFIIQKEIQLQSYCFFKVDQNCYFVSIEKSIYFGSFGFNKIKIFNCGNKNIKEFIQTKTKKTNNVLFYYYQKLKQKYIITSNDKDIKCYNFDKYSDAGVNDNDSLKIFDDIDSGDMFIYNVLFFETNNYAKLISSGLDCVIRFWDFENINLEFKISLNDYCCFCLLDENILAYSLNTNIILFDLKNKNYMHSLKDEGEIIAINTITHPKYGLILLSKSQKNEITIWIIKNNF